MVLGEPATAVVACTDEQTAVRLQHLCKSPYFRPYTNTDVIGVELGGAVKNVIALAVGVAVGMGFGDNAKAALITRGLAETVRLAVALGADEHTLAGLAGLGDLVATCSSPLSRNRTFGEKLGSGMTVDEVIDSGGTALAVAAEPVLGSAGYWLMTVTALFATAGATNSGLFLAAGLGDEMARAEQFPPSMSKRVGGRAPWGPS